MTPEKIKAAFNRVAALCAAPRINIGRDWRHRFVEIAPVFATTLPTPPTGPVSTWLPSNAWEALFVHMDRATISDGRDDEALRFWLIVRRSAPDREVARP